MKYICLGYYDEKAFEKLSDAERNAFIDDCLAYDEVLKKNGHFIGGEALGPAQSAATVGFRQGKAVVTDGPYAEKDSQNKRPSPVSPSECRSRSII
jgi:hypothetical protein